MDGPTDPTGTEDGATCASNASGRLLTRRTVLAGSLGVAGLALVGVPTASAEPAVVGRIRATYEAAGGRAVLGAPLAGEVKTRIGRRNTYGQRFERGIVWWGSGVGKVDRPAARVRLDTGRNFRPVDGVRGVWRTDDLDGCSPLERRVVADLGITAMIAMNMGGDPAIAGVRRYRYPMTNAGSHLEFYRGYVTRSANRAAVGRVVRRVARSEGAVLLHCVAGKDRTGWLSDLLQSVAGVDRATRDDGYLATARYSGREVDLAWLQAARDALTDRFGTPERYLREGCGVSATDLARLRSRLR